MTIQEWEWHLHHDKILCFPVITNDEGEMGEFYDFEIDWIHPCNFGGPME